MERQRLQYMRDILSRRPMFVFVDVMTGKRRIGQVVAINNLTTWVRIMIGAKTSIEIKRHNAKHHIEPYKMGEYYESIHTETGD
ncbi:MAG: hypothetical protein JRE23_03290 [Deltaproteobacteria bacterium]|nr:hypothetical protein [Deltaproteobacteria bacterium]